MTHEQKPESAEFRTREAHIADLAFEISDWKSYDDNEDITLARAHAEEFEARGAAEQRRKDAEIDKDRLADLIGGMEVSVDVSTCDEDAGHRLFGTVTVVQEYDSAKNGLILLVQEPKPNFEQRRKDAVEVAYYIDHRTGSASPPYAVRKLEQCAFPDQAEPVYTQPANVAALEARVKELEGAITALFDGQACFENLGFEDPPLRVVVYDDEQVATGKDPIGVAVTGAKVIAAAIREGGEHG